MRQGSDGAPDPLHNGEYPCKDPGVEESNKRKFNIGIFLFILVCCYGCVKKKKTIEIELAEARGDEEAKLIFENFEHYPRKLQAANPKHISNNPLLLPLKPPVKGARDLASRFVHEV